ncbi:MAG TPA: hypothetical protein VF522_13100 [Ramlibacter sp.]|uniref:hypothetical protein n=1 Tax=Ramlibacter sp. TaxID=1917967 RepID=UPI002ED5FE77
MKLQPISGDLVVKLAVGAALVGVAWYGLRAMRETFGDAFDGAAEWADNLAHTTLNPLSTDNAAYTGINRVGGALVTAPDGPGKNADGSWSLGGWLYDVTH